MKIFGLRLPLWATLVPLLLAVLVYWRWWEARLGEFRSDVAVAGMPVIFGGFPYRLHGEAGRTTLDRVREDTRLRLDVDRLTLDRQPAGRGLTVIGVAAPKLRAEARGLEGARLEIDAPGGRASLHVDNDRLARFSAEARAARVVVGLFPAAITADRLETHIRETPVAPIALPTGPRMPVQGELRAAASGLRLDGGDPLAMEADLAITAAAPLRSVRGWAAQQGTVEVRRLTLSDRLGVVVNLSATAVPRADGKIEIAGTATTICPLSLLAALERRAPPRPEFRARLAQRIAFGGLAGAVVARTDASGLGAFTVRAQEPPCPRLRG